MMDFRMADVVFWLLVLSRLLDSSKGVTLVVPPAGNCGDETTLTCQYTGTLIGYNWLKFGIGLINPASRPEKYRAETGTNSVMLIIKNTEVSDAGIYKCNANFVDSPEKKLMFECKASSITSQLGQNKKLSLSVDKLYPLPWAFTVTTTPIQITGNHICVSSTQYPGGYQRCVWTSQCLTAETYNYSVIVITVTQASPLTGSQTIVSPDPPVISNTETLGDSRVVVRAAEGQPVTLQCESRNGVPQSTLAWYRGSTSTAALKQQDTDVLTHQITPTKQDDRVSYICRSWYPQAAVGCRDSKTVTAMLYIALRSSLPVVSQTNTATEGELATFQCTSSGSRPAASLSWTFRGQTIATPTTPTEDSTTETFSMVSSLTKVVTRQDNGQTVGCTVTLAPFTDQTGTTNINVRFAPLAVTITGNRVIVANGVNPLELTCTSGTSNLASSISWDISGVPSSAVGSDQDLAGDYGGTRRQSVRRLKPTRNDDGKAISCFASNSINSASPPSDQAILDLNYESLITHIEDIVTVEGQTATLSCRASSKPPSTFTWKRGPSKVDEGTGTSGNNNHNYVIQDVDRTQDGTYTCTASNDAGAADTKPVHLTVHYPPDISVTTSTNTFQQRLSLQIDCTAAGKPANYSFKGFTHTWRGTMLRTYTGNSVAIASLSLEHSGTYACVANNGVPDRAGTVDQSGSKHIIVKVQPKILSQDNRFNGSPGKSFNISIPFYSYPNQTSVQIKRHGILSSSDGRFTMETVPATVTDRFHGVRVSLDGYILRLEISTLTDDDFSNFTLEMGNDVDVTVWPFSISHRSAPDMPRQVSSPGTFTTPISIWKGEFDGGYEQTFIVEVSSVGKDEWTEKASIKEGDPNHMLSNGLYYTEIRDLDPGVYLSRIYSTNKLGKSDYSTQRSTFAVLAVECSQCSEQQVSSRAIAGSVVAGIEALIIVALVVVVALLYRLRNSNNKDTGKQRKETHRKGRSDRIQLEETRASSYLYDHEKVTEATMDDKNGETNTNVYEKLDPAMKTDDVYDAVDTAKEKRKVDVNPEYINLEL